MSARDQVAAIERFKRRRRTPPAVAGFDLTFTVPKSFSMLWALARPQVQTAITRGAGRRPARAAARGAVSSPGVSRWGR